MPVLMLMRHGKSCWDGSWTSDHERPLARRGQRAAARMGRFLTDSGLEPATVISSTAKRAATTARLAAESGRWVCRIDLEPGFYGGGPEAILNIIRTLDPAVECALAIGHNPAWAETTSLLIGGCSLRFPTAAVACLDIPGAWSGVRPGRADLRWFVTPRLLEATR